MMPGRKSQLWSVALVLIALVPGCACARAQRSVVKAAERLPLLISALQVHGMSLEEASRGYPVQLRATVTYYDPDIDKRHGALFLKDASGGIFVSVPSRPILNLHAGDIVEVGGVTGGGDFAPLILGTAVRVVSQSGELPKAPLVTLPSLLTGAQDGQWIAVEGVVHSVSVNDKNISLHIATVDGIVTATTVKGSGRDYENLIDSEVRLRAVAAPLFNRKKQMTGVHLFFPGCAAIKVEKGPAADPLTLPIEPLSGLMEYTPGPTLRHRVRVRGRVTLQWPGRLLCIEEGPDGLCVATDDRTLLQDGEMVDVAGFPAIIDSEPTLLDAVLRPRGDARPVTPEDISREGSLSGEHNGQLVQVEGTVLGSGPIADSGSLLIAAGTTAFTAILPPAMSDAERQVARRWTEGSVVRLTGIWAAQVDPRETAEGEGASRFHSFRILLRSPQDVAMLRAPSWWTAKHALLVLAIVALVSLLVLFRLIALSRRVNRQTQMMDHSERRLQKLAQHDALTGLVSRSVMQEQLGLALEQAVREQTSLALLMMDVDKFKQMNDSLGHAAGDEILCIIAQRIRGSVAPDDTVARISGDEFMVLAQRVPGADEVGRLAAKLLSSVSQPVKVRGLDVPVSVSIGVSIYPEDGEDASTLLQHGDVAMFRAKARGRNCYEMFAPEMAKTTPEKLEFQVALGNALENEELELHFQPIIDLRSGEVAGVEALSRWRSERFGLVMPNDFVPVAEETGLIGPIGAWVLREACREVGLLEAKLGRSLMLSVNLSPRQLERGDFPSTVEAALASARRDPSRLELEITENVLIGDSLRTREIFERLRGLGVRLAIDDFGTGFSSLSYVTHFVIDRIKIDQSFIRNCVTDRNSELVTRIIIALAHGMNVSVVAEGVENEEQYSLLQRAECDLVQGFYLSPAVRAEQIEEVVFTLESRVYHP